MSGSLGSGEMAVPDDRKVVHFGSDAGTKHAEEPNNDTVEHPAHYTSYKGIEIIQLTEQMNFNRGNAVKYIARAGLKDPAAEVEDLEKARWYLQREIERISPN